MGPTIIARSLKIVPIQAFMHARLYSSLYQEISCDATVASKVWVLNGSRGEGAMQLKGEKYTEYYRPPSGKISELL